MSRLVSSYSLIPRVVKLLLISNIFMYFLEMANGNQLVVWLALWPLNNNIISNFGVSQAHFELFQLISYAFLHGSVMHLLLNMYALWLFGSRMENTWGARKFIIYYTVCVIGAALAQLLVSSLTGSYYPTIGASGGVFGLLLAFGMTFPKEIIMLIFPPIALQARWFVLVFGAFELFAGVTGTLAGIAHFAHLGGMVFGLMLIIYWRRYA